jgi:Flp pilus assembly protein TadD
MRRALSSLSSPDPGVADRAGELTARAHRLRRKGELRRAVVALREACALDEGNPSRWVWLADALGRTGKRDEAERALKQALYLRQQGGEKAKANVVRRLILQLGRVA